MFDYTEEDLLTELDEYCETHDFPKSMTIFDGDNLRHFELGVLGGFLLFGTLSDNDLEIVTIDRDCSEWYLSEDPFRHDVGWYKNIKDMYDRMTDWISEHFFVMDNRPPKEEMFDGFKIIKPIPEYEVIPFDERTTLKSVYMGSM